MKPFFDELLDYTFHFNNRIIEVLTHTATVPEKSVLLLNHTINAQEIWNARIQEVYCATGVWEIRPTGALAALNGINYENSKQITETFDFDKKILYTNSKGDSFENTVKDMLFHMVNHSTYHRGQIAVDFKANGLTPLVTDYIFYKRDAL